MRNAKRNSEFRIPNSELFIAYSLPGLYRLDGNAVEHTELAGQGADLVLRGVDDDADNAQLFRSIGNAHAPDNIRGVVVQNPVDVWGAVDVFDNDSD